MATKVFDKATLKSGDDIWFAMHGDPNALHSYIFVHGIGGSHDDFKEISPLLVRDNFNVIAFDLPGSGRTTVEAAGGDKLTEDRLVEVIVEAIDVFAARNTCRRFFLIGHSLGGGTAMQVAAKGRFPSILGLALINSSGFRPHVVTKPFWLNCFFYQLLILSPVTRFFTMYFVHFIAIFIMGFSPKMSKTEAALMFHRGATMNYDGVGECVVKIHNSKLPVFIASTRNDKFVEKAIRDETCAVLQPTVRIEYERGGHNIQKTRATELSQALVEWAIPIASSQEYPIKTTI
ncbi:hypothetical protein LEN26_011354 [Aphanomyces euteiches]|nr:hypothetical protein LEN26_011354 [Aphanomyces euteiches]